MTKLNKDGKTNTKYYKGNNAYANHSLTEEQIEKAAENYKLKTGPQRNSSTAIRNTCQFDYNKSLCKDYHDAGYCVFGNSCLYLHDRSTEKSGWEL